VLVTAAMLERMRTGAVIVDLAAATGGNTELTKDNSTVQHKGITIIGNSNLAATMPSDASKLYARNMYNFLQLVIRNGQLAPDFQDDIVQGGCITHNGAIVNERVKALRTSSTIINS